MFQVPANNTAVIRAPYELKDADGNVTNPDATIAGSQVWAMDNDTTAMLAPQADGSARLDAINADIRAQVVVNYTAKGINADGVEVPLVGTETYEIVDAVVVPPEPVTVPLQTTLEAK